MITELVGYWSKGKFLCVECGHDCPIKVYHVDIFPFRRKCDACGKSVANGNTSRVVKIFKEQHNEKDSNGSKAN